MRLAQTLSLLALALPALASAQAGGSDASRVREAVGNTIVETYPDGRQAEIWLKADGTYTGEGRRHDASNGTWSVKGEQICFRQLHPAIPFGMGHVCRDIPHVSVGQTWTSKAATGEPVKVRLLKGHVVPG